jgi:RimJ/RimL family protein N-acetyltransferase
VKRIARRPQSAAACTGGPDKGPTRAADWPPGYPLEYQRQVTLRDGRQVFIRPILPSDAPELADAIKTADPGTLRRRFLGRPPRVTPALLAHMATVDYVRRFALVAIDSGTQKGVAIARFKQTGAGVAEIAVAVSPAWRRVGLATMLIQLLAKAALERGIHTFSARYLANNRPVAALVEDADWAGEQTTEHGIAEASLALGSRRVRLR